ncbi:MAG: response regulator transcription factor [Candidatus Bipolaricaulis sp.]|nr:response regulator transcription factor [Candidatus Bipolaricaulis sp.]
MIRVVLADDHAVVREGLRHVLEADGDIEVVGEAGDGREAIRIVKATNADVAVLDVAMPVLDGIEATRRIVRDTPSTRCVLLSMYTNPHYARSAMEAGALGFVVKGSPGRELVSAVRAAHAGHRHLSQELLDSFVGDVVGSSEARRQGAPFDRLTQRERETIRRVMDGQTSAEIAQLLHLSPKTVETYRSRAMTKLGVRGPAELVRLAIKHGIIPPE